VVRSTWLYSQPTIKHPINYRIVEGTVVNVVGRVGEEWFKIASRYERPPAYIRRSEVRVRRHLMQAGHYRLFRDKAFATWRDVATGLEVA